MSRHLFSCLTIAGVVAVFCLATGTASAQPRHPIVQTGLLCEKVGGPGGGTGTANYGVGGLVTNTNATPGATLTVACPVVQSANGGVASATAWVLDRSFGADVMCRLAVYRKDGFIAAVTVDRNSSATNFNCQQLDFGSFPVQPDDRIVLTCTIPAQNPFGGTSGVCTYKTK